MLFGNLSERHRQPEIMDQPGLAEKEHRHALQGLELVNRLSCSAARVWPAVTRAAEHRAGGAIRILDVACGAGDVAISLARRAQRNGLNVEVAGCDISPVALRYARERAAASGVRIEFFEADVLGAPLPGNFDVVTCSLFLHHLDEPQATEVLRRMAAATRQMVLVNDLLRSRWGYLLAYLGTRVLTTSKVVHVDGPLSVEGAFTAKEILRLAEEAGLVGVRFTRCWPARYILSWSRV